MLTVSQAQKVILKNILPIKDSQILKLSLSLGRISSEDIKSKDNIPPFNNSAMDGFAIRANDSVGASRKYPKIFQVIEDLPAGYLAKKSIKQGQAIRMMTGAPLPKGADAVVMQEDTRKVTSHQSPAHQCTRAPVHRCIEIYKEIKPGENVRYVGEDIRKGEIIVRKGTVLTPGYIGVLASLGFPKIKVFRKPKVAILSTGDELVDIKQRLSPGKIRNSNAYSLYAQVIKAGGDPVLLGIARDTKKDLARKIRSGINADMLLISGGVSVGEYDLVKDALADSGAKMYFWKVAMRPGKPIAFGIINRTPIFGLPGNPVSSMVSFEIFVRPAILKMFSNEVNLSKTVFAVLEEDIKKKDGLRYFLRANTRWEGDSFFTKTTGPQGSGILKSMALANSLIILPEDATNIPKGQKVKVVFI